MQQSLRERQLSVTQWDKTPIFKNQISAEDRKRGGTGESTKDNWVLIVNVAARQTATENTSFICHASCCHSFFCTESFLQATFFCLGQFLFGLCSSLMLWMNFSQLLTFPLCVIQSNDWKSYYVPGTVQKLRVIHHFCVFLHLTSQMCLVVL